MSDVTNNYYCVSFDSIINPIGGAFEGAYETLKGLASYATDYQKFSSDARETAKIFYSKVVDGPEDNLAFLEKAMEYVQGGATILSNLHPAYKVAALAVTVLVVAYSIRGYYKKRQQDYLNKIVPIRPPMRKQQLRPLRLSRCIHQGFLNQMQINN